MDARALENEAVKLRTDATSMQNQAGQLKYNADGHNRDGDAQRAEVETTQAA